MKASIKDKLQGIFAPVVTPFADNEDIDLDALKHNLSLYARTDLGGFLALGSNGENKSLSESEKLNVVETVLAGKHAEQTVVVGVMYEAQRHAERFIAAVADLGADFALVQSPSYFKKLITSSADIIVTTDWRGRVRVWNPAAERILGYKPNEIRGRSVLRLYKSSDEARRVMRKMRERGGMLSNEEVEVVTKGGEVVPLSLSAAILYDTDGNEVGTVGVSRDLRPMKRLQEQLIEAQKKAAIQKTVVTLSHYINNQLMAQVALLSDLACEAQKISDGKLRRYFEDGLRRSLSRAFQIAQITKTLQNPQEIKEEQYIGELEMLSVPLPESVEPEAIEARKFGKLKVLVADDEPVIRDGFAEFLRHFGLEVDTAEDGEQAIRLIKENDYDLVISDIKMPKATGYDVFHAAKAKNPNVNVLLMTAFGYDPDHTVVKAAREGLEGVFFKEKPFDMSKLIALIEKIFSK